MKIEETVCVYDFFFHGMLEFGNNILSEFMNTTFRELSNMLYTHMNE